MCREPGWNNALRSANRSDRPDSGIRNRNSPQRFVLVKIKPVPVLRLSDKQLQITEALVFPRQLPVNAQTGHMAFSTKMYGFPTTHASKIPNLALLGKSRVCGQASTENPSGQAAI